MHNLSRMGSEDFDILVIGGGVTGAGVALDAVARGYKVALVEKADFASGTSSKSTKLVHGGIRYLPEFDFALVHEALVERGLLLQNAPFLVAPLAFVLPIYEGDLHPVGMPFTTPRGIGLSYLLDIGLWMYDIMAGRRNIHLHRRISRQKVMELAPAMTTQRLKEGFVYYDAQTNDVRLTITLIRTAATYGATIANYAEVTAFEMQNGKIVAARVHDRLGGQDITVRARHFINATGIFSEQVEALTGKTPQVSVEPSKGVHLVFAREKLMLGKDAIVLPETDDKRIIFIVPWESRAVVGTTDTGSGDLDHPVASHEDVTYLLEHLKRYLSVDISQDDILTTYAGYRPLLKPSGTGTSTAKLSRSHSVLQSPSGLVTIVGGKLTTYRRMAQDTLDVINRRDGMKPIHPTERLLLQGSAGWPVQKQKLAQRGMALGLDDAVIEHLGKSYGTQAQLVLDLIEQDSSLKQRLIPDLPYVRADVVFACRQEMAMTPYDVLGRRTAILLTDGQRGLGVVDEVAALMARELQWSPEQQRELVNAYRAAIEQQKAAEVAA
jgi:glycerol-3-phosphate dehydrogenase